MKTLKKEREIFDLYDLMLEQVRDLYDGERQQLNFLLDVEKKVTSFELDETINMHRRETKIQLDRLDKIFDILDEVQTGESCEGIQGIISDTQNLIDRCQNPEVCDAAIITAIQHINHYEIAGYGTAIAYAKAHERHDIGEILLETLREEKEADLGLTDLAENYINPDAKWTSLVEKVEGKKERKKHLK
ncbi:ferritin-like domain-containing protein [Fodinibius halophilus]|uniref:DUF892 family protein n=1 Tax=Fodinibius halophilus TaxID=1736908 RepID=A0A6M1T6X7_9BACT|nr:DUF892 family protein [Fodinibius halophilus]NGP89859.1 DUF892 family protein [Fodinibius halophilus]